MKQLTLFWSETPRWLQGLFLANLCYITFTGLGLVAVEHHYWQNAWLDQWLPPTFLPVKGDPGPPTPFLYHLLWCLLGALSVQLFGRARGILILLVFLYAAGMLLMKFSLLFDLSFQAGPWGLL